MESYLELLKQHHRLPKACWDIILADATFLKIKRNAKVVLNARKLVNKKVFVVAGHFKHSYIQEDGAEKIFSFGFAGDYLIEPFKKGAGDLPVETIFQAMSDAELLVFDLHNKAASSYLSLQVGLDISNFAMKQLAEHLYILGLRSPYDRYKYLLEHKPQILKNIALTEVSKYLHTSREALSRARVHLLDEFRFHN
jgi:CRP-like cAMP-binding protein